MRCQAGVGGDPHLDEPIDITTNNGLFFYGGKVYEDNKIWFYATRTDNSGQGFMCITYTGNSEVNKDDTDFLTIINSIELAKSYGTVTILADELNVRDYEGTSSEITGKVYKGETYPVYCISNPTTYTEYTWYNIGDMMFIADKNGEWVEFSSTDNWK